MIRYEEERGFTLVEIVAVMLILGVLVAFAWLKWNNSHEKALEATLVSDMRNLALVQEIYYRDHGVYAASAAEISVLLDPSPRSTLHITDASNLGWAGWNEIEGAEKNCEYYVGSGMTSPLGIATSSERVACGVP